MFSDVSIQSQNFPELLHSDFSRFKINIGSQIAVPSELRQFPEALPDFFYSRRRVCMHLGFFHADLADHKFAVSVLLNQPDELFLSQLV